MTSKKIIKRSGAAILLLIILYFISRNFILHLVTEKISGRLKERFNLNLVIEKSAFSGLITVEMNNLSIVPQNGDTLLHLDTLSATPSFSSLLLFNLRLKALEMKSGYIRLNCTDSTYNYASLLSKKSVSDTSTIVSAEKNYASLFYRFFSKSFDFAPQDAEVRNLGLIFITDSFRVDVNIPDFLSSKEKIEGELQDMKQNKSWKVTGIFDQDNRQYDLTFYPLDNHAQLPLLKELAKISCSFDTIHAALNESNFSNNFFRMSGVISANAFSLYHHKISNDTIKVAHGLFNYNVTISSNSISLDSTSSMMLNRIFIHPYFKLSSGKSRIYELSLRTDTTMANDFFSSLLPGMFDETRDIKADGKLQYALRFRLDTSEPDSVEFDSGMRKINFRFRKSGRENLLKMNSEFLHTVYERDRAFRSFMVGPSNPDFTPLDQASQHLMNAILTSEDGSFFFHNGFNEEAFRKSIAENYRKGKFVRGGSTISMQLVKNVFLSRHKTVARKAEEALIVWLIESNHLSGKERMFEVYLNIIELAPGIYGIGEASRFYFNKKPSDLTLSESIFIASLLPHPKWFKYSFDKQGNLKPYLADYYRVVANFLLRKNLITQDEYSQIQPNVELKGIAKELVLPTDTIPIEELEQM